MTIEEARRVLCVTAGTRGQDLKRAYLRQVKASPPERDPVGFARVRKAYELLAQSGAAFAEASPLVTTRTEHPLAHNPSNHSDGSPQPEPQASHQPEPQASHQPESQAPRQPESQAPRQPEPQPAVAQLSAELEALNERLFEAPETLTEAELEQLASHPDCADEVEWEPARRGDTAFAQRYAAQVAFAASNPSTRAPDVPFGLHVLLGLEASGQHELVNALTQSLSPFIDVSNKDAFNRTDVVLRLGLVQELAQLPPEANAVRRIVGGALLEHRPEGARAEVDAFAKTNPKLAKQLFAHLDDKSPLLRQMLYGTLLTKSDRRFMIQAVMFVVLVVVVGVIDKNPRWFVKCGRLLLRLWAAVSQ